MAAATRSATASSPPSTRSEAPKPGRFSITSLWVRDSGPAMRSKLVSSASSEWNSTMGAPVPPVLAATAPPSTCSVRSVNCGADSFITAFISSLFQYDIGNGFFLDLFEAALAGLDAEQRHHDDQGKQ